MADRGRGSAGFQAALETYLARGGPLRNDSTRGKAGTRYTEGPLRGLTEEQAISRARRLWMRASPQVRAKYERMEQATMAPPAAPAPVAAAVTPPKKSPKRNIAAGKSPAPPLQRPQVRPEGPRSPGGRRINPLTGQEFGWIPDAGFRPGERGRIPGT